MMLEARFLTGRVATGHRRGKYAKKAYDLDKGAPRIAANLAVAYHYVGDMENRDRFTRIAEQLGYDKVDTLEQIYSGELTLRD